MPDPDPDAEIKLLERATEGVEVIPCPECDETGCMPDMPVPVLCRRCNGTKLTTNGTKLTMEGPTDGAR